MATVLATLRVLCVSLLGGSEWEMDKVPAYRVDFFYGMRNLELGFFPITSHFYPETDDY